MSKPVVEPVTGQNLCPTCGGARVLPAGKTPVRAILSDLQKYYGAMMWDDDGNNWVWCAKCGGSGTATDAMERLLLGVTTI